MDSTQKIIPINIEEEMKSAYIDYSMSVIVSRALPDVRDGLKPVHRRVLYGMSQLGLTFAKGHKKSARIVGEVLGKYHPHGDTSVYDTMVRMAQPWSLRYPLVNGQGNFGSVDGDSPAAMRYTEAKLERISNELLADLGKNTVDFQLNFDDSLKEPTVLPTKIPSLLVNGASGIAVGMATNMLPHNLSEVINGILAYIDNHDITIEELIEHIKAPDFPTGGTIYGTQGVHQAMATGRGRVVVRAKTEIEVTKSGKERIIVTEIPYQVNKANLIVKIAELVNSKKVEGISDLRDESDRKGMRIVIELKRDVSPNVVLSKLFKYSPLQSSYGVNNICLVDGRPELLNVKDIIREFVKFRLEVIYKRAVFDKDKATKRAHVLQGLLAALDRLDEIISLIRASKNADEAKEALMAFDFTPKGDALDSFLGENPLNGNRLSEEQAKAILEMRLQRLTGLERDKLIGEFNELILLIADLTDIIENESRRYSIIKEELTEVNDKYGDERRTDITYAEGEISIEDMIENEKVVVTISHLGYIKRTSVSEYRTQSRGGVGANAAKTRDKDFVEHIFVTNTHNYLLLFTAQGRCHWLRVYEVPKGAKASKGRAIQNLLQLQPGDKIKAYIPIENLKDEEFLKSHNLIFATKHGIVKKTDITAYSRPRTNGVNALTIRENDELIEVKLTDGSNHIILATREGKAIRFNEKDVREMGRTATGVKGIKLGDFENNVVVGMVCVAEEDEKTILVVAENGIGKRTLLDEYRPQTRGGKGVKTINVTAKTGNLIAIKAATDNDDMVIINKSGITIRLAVKNVPTTGRATQGVKLIDLRKKDAIADVGLIIDGQLEAEEDKENTEEVEGTVTENTEENTNNTSEE
ncbi:DNA gyrase subunit A [Aureispira anguillae]|uniref:DNA gyrase subunit A n=1 Tax=Aureispira anguillae TaxID=2864201 RepID=A0A916DT17_9BACT|nr:DNA gyrase subunit A [Aureispira anguillae]BDS11171.1 DNA gyrase subunit A [Aureispira anguillae]